MFEYQNIIDKYYPQGSALRVIYTSHCRQVAELALEIAARLRLPIDKETIECAAMLHDIGIFLCDAPALECRGTHPYILHGVLGADLLRREGVPEEYALVAERHTGSGITSAEAKALALPADRSYLPDSLLERLICYADKFYSKSGSAERKSTESVRKSMARFGTEALKRFDALQSEFKC